MQGHQELRRDASRADESNSMEDESPGRGTAWATHLAGLTRIRPIKAGGFDERRETTHCSAYVDGRHVAILGGTPPRRLPSLAVPHAFRWFQSQPPQQAGLAQCASLLPLVQSHSAALKQAFGAKMSNSSAMNISKYAIKYTGNPSTDAAKAKSMKQDGPFSRDGAHTWSIRMNLSPSCRE